MTDDQPRASDAANPAPPEPYADSLPQVPRDPTPEPGDPPPSVRGPVQVVVDPPGDAADDGALRWDPRTQTTDQREGG